MHSASVRIFVCAECAGTVRTDILVHFKCCFYLSARRWPSDCTGMQRTRKEGRRGLKLTSVRRVSAPEGRAVAPLK